MSDVASPPDGQATEDIPGVTRRHRLSDFYHERTNFQFIKHSRRWLILSSTFMVIAFVLLATRGLNLGIDFKGGTAWNVNTNGKATVSGVRDVIRPLGFNDAKVSILTSQGASGKSQKTIRVEAKVVKDAINKLETALADYAQVSKASVQYTPEGSGGNFQVTTKPSFAEPTKDGVLSAIAPVGVQNPAVTVNGRDITVNVPTLPVSPVTTVGDALAKYANARPSDVSISTVGPTWGHEVSQKAIKALIFFFLLLAIYLSIRFEWKMAVAAIVAVIHDIIFTVGVYALFQFQVSPATITAFLTILGFSLYDTVVVFDKVIEYQRTLTATGRMTYGEMVNRALNAVLMRSISTSLVALLPVLSLLFVGSGIFGATALEDFALALAAGLFIGSYSSIFVAAPLLAWWKEKEPQYRALADRRRRVAAAAASASVGVPVVAPDEPGEPGEPAAVGVPGPPAVPRGPIQPRARQQRRRKRH
jgi:preprotein translocase subunit SecF